MVRAMSIVLALAFVVTVLSATPALAKGKKGNKGPKVPDGYATVQSVDTSAKSFTLSDGKTYKFTDSTTNKNLIYTGAVIKVTVKEGSDQVTAVEAAAGKQGKKGKKK